jgi:hypothetical protein
MALLTPDPRGDEERPGGESGLHLDLDEKACPVCRRDLLPWQPTCPADGAGAVPRTSLRAAGLAEPPAHLLADGDEDDAERGQTEAGDL